MRYKRYAPCTTPKGTCRKRLRSLPLVDKPVFPSEYAHPLEVSIQEFASRSTGAPLILMLASGEASRLVVPPSTCQSFVAKVLKDEFDETGDIRRCF